MFITFEGIEGCGKTTQVKRFAKRLKGLGISLITTLEPGGTRIGKDIRKILLDSRNRNLSPLTELFLYAADRAQHVEELIKPALDEGKWVICDRFFDATVAYQGIARGQDMELIGILNEEATQGIQPDITFLLDCPVHMGLNRALERNETQSQKGQDRFEREALDFHRAVREGYLELARKNQDRFVIIDTTLPKDEVEEKIFQHIEPFLDK
ncbi:MAG: dTMP kinase [Desulfobacteraceae bacterium]|nr:dTMP kinase [Desulfobacteraceae bacterium]